MPYCCLLLLAAGMVGFAGLLHARQDEASSTNYGDALPVFQEDCADFEFCDHVLLRRGGTP